MYIPRMYSSLFTYLQEGEIRDCVESGKYRVRLFDFNVRLAVSELDVTRENARARVNVIHNAFTIHVTYCKKRNRSESRVRGARCKTVRYVYFSRGNKMPDQIPWNCLTVNDDTEAAACLRKIQWLTGGLKERSKCSLR